MPLDFHHGLLGPEIVEPTLQLMDDGESTAVSAFRKQRT